MRLWEEQAGAGGSKNQIHRHHHHWDKGGREDLMIATPGRDDTYASSGMYAYMVLLDVQLAAGEGEGAAQDALKDNGGGMVVGGGEDRGKDRSNADGNGYGHRHGHGQRGRNEAKSIGGG